MVLKCIFINDTTVSVNITSELFTVDQDKRQESNPAAYNLATFTMYFKVTQISPQKLGEYLHL